MKILITGGSGFLGYHLVRYFENRDIPVSIIDIAPFQKHDFQKKHKFFQIDIRNKKKLDNIIKNHTHIIHTAASLPLWKKEDIFSTNVNGTKNILSLAYKYKIKKVIYISSTAVYGVPKKHPVYEDDPLIGVGPYGESKIQAEQACLSWMKKGLPITILRPKTFVGTGRLGVFEILFDWIHDGKKIPIIGSGNNRYQLLDVDDLVDVIGFIIKSKSKKVNDIFNVGAEEYGTVREDLQALFSYAKSGSTLLPLPPFPVKTALRILEMLNLSPLYQWIYDTADKDSFVSIEKLIKTTGWHPRFSNKQSLIKAYAWYQKHYRKIKNTTPGLTHRVGWNQKVLGIVKKFF